jgi:molecular chaperone GrpE (heat shock protein)
VTLETCPDTAVGLVLRVIRRGQKMHDRLLRPAHVVVATGPELETTGEEGEGDER